MRIGSRVAITRMREDGTWERYTGCKKRPEGTVIALEVDDCDGHIRYDFATIRWDDGRVERIRTEGEDEIGTWELEDVTPELYANLYLWDRGYGGSEEGGWWYDVYTPADGDWNEEPPKHGLFATAIEAENAAKALREWCDNENQSRRSPSSVISEGHFVVRVEAWPAEPYPARKPHYC